VVARERHRLAWRWSWLTHALGSPGYLVPSENLNIRTLKVDDDELRRAREALVVVPHAPPGIGKWTHNERLWAAPVALGGQV
jgi:hypothetical protein